MTDDIVTRLRQFVRQCNHGWNLGNDWYPAPTECVSCIRQRDAADEIERLRLNVNLVIAVNRQMRDELQNLAEELRLMSERYE